MVSELMSAGIKPWLGLVAAPVLFLSNMQLNFMLAPWVCGNGHHWLIHLAHAVTFALIAACGLPAWHGMRRTAGGQQFIATLSVLMSAFIGLALIGHWIPNFLLGACE